MVIGRAESWRVRPQQQWRVLTFVSSSSMTAPVAQRPCAYSMSMRPCCFPYDESIFTLWQELTTWKATGLLYTDFITPLTALTVLSISQYIFLMQKWPRVWYELASCVSACCGTTRGKNACKMIYRVWLDLSLKMVLRVTVCFHQTLISKDDGICVSHLDSF